MNEADAALQLIRKDFDLVASKPSLGTKQDVLVYLSEAILHLLDTDFERLLQIMYRIDIDENKFKQVLQGEKPDTISLKLAELVFDRELQKVQSRAKYRGNSGSRS